MHGTKVLIIPVSRLTASKGREGLKYWKALCFTYRHIGSAFDMKIKPSILEYCFPILHRYPQYKIISDSLITLSAHVRTRNTAKGLRGVIIDIHFLSKCDYLVCTFSSQVSEFNICKYAYVSNNLLFRKSFLVIATLLSNQPPCCITHIDLSNCALQFCG